MDLPEPAALLDLSGKVALVTGANGGIGPAIGTRLAQAGAVVAFGVHRGTERATAAAAPFGDRATVVHGDVQDPDGPAALVETTVERLGRLDIVVNNAALQPVQPMLEIDAGSWDELALANVRGPHLLTRAAAEVMIAAASGGSIVNIGSIEGRQPAVGHGHYSVSKAALAMHTRAAALELGEHEIRVNCVSPGLIDDGQLRDRWPDGVERWLRAAPLGRLGSPDDVADAVVFLASPLARWITGADLVVDGGVLARPTW